MARIVLTSLQHHRYLHMSRRVILQFFNMFFHPAAKDLCNQVAAECVACIFNANCKKRKTVGIHARDTPHPRKIFCGDFIENLPVSSMGHRFVANYTVFLPLRNKSSRSLSFTKSSVSLACRRSWRSILARPSGMWSLDHSVRFTILSWCTQEPPTGTRLTT